MNPTQEELAKSLAEALTQADLLAAAILGEYPIQVAMTRWINDLKSEYDRATATRKLQQALQRFEHPQQYLSEVKET